MKPSAVLLGFVLGSSVAITFALIGVAVVFVWLRPQYPLLEAELPALWLSLSLFAGLTALAGASFYGTLRGTRWRHAAAGALALYLAVVGWVYWPK